MSKPQLQQAAVLVILPDIKTNTQQQCCIKEMASKLATSSSSATVGERAARTTTEPMCSHRRHGQRERRDQRHSRGRRVGIHSFMFTQSFIQCARLDRLD